ncbi:hypothetical protein [Paracoccus laeviglucosivorans]|uniref:YjbR protein n=1 Tax=Paracoccus laeviglucosivorans TaxID=1197861 RepID=A0A521C7N9_9RHOB|nr:hypothetical protein [Paracoccus laeviglucosivorans]SMO54821.1 hypothetical protein SAMN06265221_10411 [Paracoccus laeviglucosivorans]
MSDVSPAAGALDGARAAWDCLQSVALPAGWRRDLTENGFIQHDLRFYHGDDWMFSAVMNQGWVLWYSRRPAIRAGLVDPAAMLDAFPDARWKDKGEVKLRLSDESQAQAVWDWTMGR